MAQQPTRELLERNALRPVLELKAQQPLAFMLEELVSVIWHRPDGRVAQEVFITVGSYEDANRLYNAAHDALLRAHKEGPACPPAP